MYLTDSGVTSLGSLCGVGGWGVPCPSRHATTSVTCQSVNGEDVHGRGIGGQGGSRHVGIDQVDNQDTVGARAYVCGFLVDLRR